jgi:hypothetical protein
MEGIAEGRKKGTERKEGKKGRKEGKEGQKE